MTTISRRCAALLCALACIAAAPLPKSSAPPTAFQSIRFSTASSLDVGAKAWSESDDDAGIAGMELFLSAGTDRERPATNGLAALTAECILHTPVGGVPLRDAIAARGGALQYSVDGRVTRYYLEGRSERLAELARIFARALAAPAFFSTGLAAAREALGRRVDDLDNNPLAVGLQMFRRAYYPGGEGLPALGNRNALSALAGADLQTFFQTYYVRGGAAASVVGKIGADAPDALRALVAALPAGTVSTPAAKANPIPQKTSTIIARRDVSAPIVVIGFAAPAPGSRDFGAMLVLQALLTDTFERVSTTTLSLGERSIGAIYLYDGLPAGLAVYVNGNRVDPALAIKELLVVSKTLADRPLNDATLRRFKSAAQGTFVTDATAYADRAYYLGTFGAYGLGADPLNAALASLDNATASDVQRVAKRYLQRFVVALVVPRQTSTGN